MLSNIKCGGPRRGRIGQLNDDGESIDLETCSHSARNFPANTLRRRILFE
jgi:hypothetical protein